MTINNDDDENYESEKKEFTEFIKTGINESLLESVWIMVFYFHATGNVDGMRLFMNVLTAMQETDLRRELGIPHIFPN